MAKNLETSVTLSLLGNFGAKIKSAGAGLSSFTKSSVSGLASLGRGVQWSSDKLDGFANRYTGALSAIAGAGAIRSTANLEHRLERLGVAADKSTSEMRKINEEIYQTAQMRDVNVAPEELTSAIEKIVSMTGDIDFARENMKNLGVAISATGASGEDIGAMIGNMFQKFDIKSAEDILSVLDMLANQGKTGSFELRDMATQGERIMSAYATLGRTGKEGLREMGALMQISRMGTGSAEQAATAFEAMTKTFTDPKKLELLERSGIAVKDAAGEILSVPEILKNVMLKTDGNAEELNKLFDTFAFRGVSALAIELRNAVNQGKSAEEAFATLDKFYAVQDDGTTILADSQRMAKTFKASWSSLKTLFMQFSHQNLQEPIEKTAKFLNSLDPEQIKKYFEYAKTGGLALAGVWAGGKVWKYGSMATNFFKGGKGGLGAVAKSGLMAGATPVYVVNMGSGGLGADVTSAASANNVANAAGLALGTKVIIAGAVLGAAAYVGDAIGQGIAGIVAEEYEEAGTNFGKVFGAALFPVFGPLGKTIGENTGSYLGRFFDGLKKQNTEIKNQKQRQQTVMLQTNNSFKVISDEKGVRVVDNAPNNMTKIPLKLDEGFTGYGY